MKPNMKIIGGFGAISLGMTAYIALMGVSANRATAVAIHEFSQSAVDNWNYVATSLDIPLRNTKPGELSPVIPERYSALDLVVYGYELVTTDYQDYYRELDMPRMVNQLHIETNDKGQLQYNVGGVQLISIEDSDGHGGAAFFMDVPKQLIDQTSRLYDNVPASADDDGEGVVRYDRLEDGRYVMGLFLNYTQPVG